MGAWRGEEMSEGNGLPIATRPYWWRDRIELCKGKKTEPPLQWSGKAEHEMPTPGQMDFSDLPGQSKREWGIEEEGKMATGESTTDSETTENGKEKPTRPLTSYVTCAWCCLKHMLCATSLFNTGPRCITFPLVSNERRGEGVVRDAMEDAMEMAILMSRVLILLREFLGKPEVLTGNLDIAAGMLLDAASRFNEAAALVSNTLWSFSLRNHAANLLLVKTDKPDSYVLTTASVIKEIRGLAHILCRDTGLDEDAAMACAHLREALREAPDEEIGMAITPIAYQRFYCIGETGATLSSDVGQVINELRRKYPLLESEDALNEAMSHK